MRVYSQGGVEPRAHLFDRLGYLPGERTAVRVAKNEPFSTGVPGRFQHLHCVVRIVLPTIEEVLRVEDDVLARSGQETDRIRDDLQVLLQRDSQRFRGMQVPGLAEDADPFGVGVQQRPHGQIILGWNARLPGRAECHEFRVLQFHFLGRLEERLVLRVGSGVSAFHEVNTERIQPL